MADINGVLNVSSRHSAGDLEFFDNGTGTTILALKQGTTLAPVNSLEVTATTAQVNAGLTLLAANANATVTVVGVWLSFTGTAAGATDIRISDTAGSPVDVITVLVAAANGTIVTEAGGSNITVGTFAAALTAAKGLQIRKTGSALTGTTSVKVRVLYRLS